jgi:hypothetical protein
MAYYSIFPDKDSTIYGHPSRDGINTGGDEILELVLEQKGKKYYPSRVLIKFKDEDIKDVIENKLSGLAKHVTPDNCQINLQLFTTEHKNLSKTQQIEAYPISQSWEEGVGRWTATPTASSGTTWVYRDSDNLATWLTGSYPLHNGLYIQSTGSFAYNNGGGTWYVGDPTHVGGEPSNFVTTQSFSYADDLDLNLDVTKIVSLISNSIFRSDTYPDGIPNEGFIIKRPYDLETISGSTGTGQDQLKYFSVDTHTIYPPKLTFKWDDSSYNVSGGGATLDSGDIFVTLNNNKAEFQRKSKQRFRLNVRKRYPDRAFSTGSNYLKINYLPQTSYYSVRDASTNEVIIPFDSNYTKLSADSNGTYFDLWMEGLQPERYYKLMFKAEMTDGIQIYDEDYYFKIVR